MTIRIVSHCYAAALPHYAEFLKYQLSSLALNPVPCPVAITVCYCPADEATWDVLRWFGENEGIGLDPLPLPLPALGRRSIGRNTAALESTEDLIWFCDVDHVFGPGCLSALWETWRRLRLPEYDRALFRDSDSPPMMIFPRHIKIHKDHATGDAAALRARGKFLVEIDPAEFIDKTYSRAIGGIQIADGEHVRKYGYLAGTKWQEPRTDGRPFADFKDDLAFRRQVSAHGRIEGIELPSLYRLRHSTTTYQ